MRRHVLRADGPSRGNQPDYALLVVRADESHRRAVESALWNGPTIARVEEFGTRMNGWQYRVTWDGHARRVVQRLVAEDVTLLAAQARANRWKLCLLAPGRNTISRAHEALEDLSCESDWESITAFDGGRLRHAEMSDTQHEILFTAVEMGYYDVPRNITTEELGISHQVLSERFRRAHKYLVENKLVVD